MHLNFQCFTLYDDDKTVTKADLSLYFLMDTFAYLKYLSLAEGDK